MPTRRRAAEERNHHLDAGNFLRRLAFRPLTFPLIPNQPPHTLKLPGETVMANPFVHVELATTDLRRAKAFYGRLFDWKMEDLPMPAPGGTYTIIAVGKGTGGGMMKQMVPGAGSAWMPYVLVQDIDAATKKAKRLRAKIMKGVTEVEGMGWLSIIVDPTGAMLGLWEPKSR
jgi:predicted enzyme related to lactoylglutathione lyase